MLEWYELAGYVVGILGIILGTIFYTKWNQAVVLLKELGEAFTATANALEDKKLTKDEAIRLLKEWKDVYVQVMLIMGKK